MNKTTTLMSILTYLASSQVLAIEEDKALHLTYSFATGGASQLYLEDWKKAMLVCGSIGFGKELYDEYSYGGFDIEDLTYDIVGCASGVLLSDLGLKLTRQEDVYGLEFSYRF